MSKYRFEKIYSSVRKNKKLYKLINSKFSPYFGWETKQYEMYSKNLSKQSMIIKMEDHVGELLRVLLVAKFHELNRKIETNNFTKNNFNNFKTFERFYYDTIFGYPKFMTMLEQLREKVNNVKEKI